MAPGPRGHPLILPPPLRENQWQNRKKEVGDRDVISSPSRLCGGHDINGENQFCLPWGQGKKPGVISARRACRCKAGVGDSKATSLPFCHMGAASLSPRRGKGMMAGTLLLPKIHSPFFFFRFLFFIRRLLTEQGHDE